MTPAAGADDELADASRRIRHTIWPAAANRCNHVMAVTTRSALKS